LRVVFLCPNVPFPPRNGGEQRNFGLIRALARFASVHVLAIGDPNDERASLARAALAGWDATIETYRPTGPGPAEEDATATTRLPDAVAHFRSPDLAAALGQLCAATAFDVAHVEEVVMAQYLAGLPGPRVIDRQKIDWAYHESVAAVEPQRSLLHLREAARFRRWEPALVGEFARVLVPGEGDRRLLAPLYASAAIELVPIAVADELRPPQGTRRVEYVLLYGALDYAPNVEAQAWFFREVWPALRAAAPDLRVMIVGSGRAPLSAAPPPSDPRVEVRGFVPDIAEILQGPSVLAVPVHVGGGVRTKVIEALACGMPVVSTALGVENIELASGRDYLHAESGAEMAAVILRLVQEPTLASAVGRAGSARVESNRWSHIDAQVESIYRDVAAMSTRSASSPRPQPSATAAAAFSSEIARIEMSIQCPAHGKTAVDRLRNAVITSRIGPPARRLLDRILTPSGRGGPREWVRRALARVLWRLVRH
jgi:polysaccharide biosynthesis protein PslH